MQTVHFLEHPGADEVVFEHENALDWIKERYPHGMPTGLRIFRECVAISCDITPVEETDFAHIMAAERVCIVNFPEIDGGISYIVVGVIVAALAVTLLKPKIPALGTSQSGIPSPNNALSDRQNSARPNNRIPDIYGTVRSVPDLVAQPYKVFVNNEEFEYCYMCIGRGAYDIDGNQIYDDATPIYSIDGASVEVYGPNTSPNSASPSPQLRVGPAINTRVLDVQRYTSVNGQSLLAPDAGKITATITAHGEGPPYYFTVGNDSNGNAVDLTVSFHAGDSIQLGGSVSFNSDHDIPGNPATVGLNGTYLIQSVSTNRIDLSNPQSVNSNWDKLVSSAGSAPSTLTNTSQNGWIGPFIMDKANASQIWFNFVAENGLYTQNSDGYHPVGVAATIGITPVNAANAPIGPEATYGILMQGKGGQDTGSKGSTVRIGLVTPGRQSVRVVRTSNTPFVSNGNFVDSVKWRDMYGVAGVAAANFGNVTTIQSVTQATEGALSIKDRKLNLLCTRRVHLLNPDGTPTGVIAGTNDARGILYDVLFDPYIGNRTAAEVDLQNLFTEINTVGNWFGTGDALNFCYTFDDSSTSFEETVDYIAQAVFCNVYRIGNVIQFKFEWPDRQPNLLFNHRNKVPKSEKRNIRFGNDQNYDSVFYDYVDPVDETKTTIFIPNANGKNPQKIDSVGIRNYHQAYFQAWRAWNKIQYQNYSTEFTATEEALIAGRGDFILVADQTRDPAEINDGEVVDMASLTVRLSQPFETTSLVQHYIWLQLYDGTMQSIAITRHEEDHTLVDLASAPRVPLLYDPSVGYNYTKYWIVPASTPQPQQFIVQTREDKGGKLYEVTALNFDTRFYANDRDLLNGVIT